jgi:hypothetical protein
MMSGMHYKPRNLNAAPTPEAEVNVVANTIGFFQERSECCDGLCVHNDQAHEINRMIRIVYSEI